MKEQRRILGITQAQLAERVNTSTNLYSLDRKQAEIS
jgi:transcriptional regulator with XRE-family HTH domain